MQGPHNPYYHCISVDCCESCRRRSQSRKFRCVDGHNVQVRRASWDAICFNFPDGQWVLPDHQIPVYSLTPVRQVYMDCRTLQNDELPNPAYGVLLLPCVAVALGRAWHKQGACFDRTFSKQPLGGNCWQRNSKCIARTVLAI